ncbi:uncharacterized protein LOC132800144 [Ziziphus jujuba]|uniref:Uncharacterized protein LOC132800144 n=1 Tax=Ziziphus jujuba TaxID=326968 RepID=A0ABM3ZXD1_ZIZJJ|nr:uncharacterized protein LOC132800144 [Ziziphus jujuba]
MKTIADNLEAAVEFVHETYFAFYILGGLGLEFDPISENLNSQLDLINLIESFNANSENLSANPVGLSVNSLKSLNFNAAVSNSQHNHSVDNFMRHVKFPSNIGFHFANNNQTYSPNSQRFVQDIRGSRGYNNRGRALQGPNPSSFLIGMQSGFRNSASAMSFTPTLFQFQPQLGVQGQFGHGSQMLAGSFGPSNVSLGYSNALVSPGNFMPSAQPNNMVGQNVIGPNGFGHFPSSQLPVLMLANLTSYNVPSTLYNNHNPTTNVVSTSLQKDPSWFLDSGATNHAVADGDSLLEQIEYQCNNKLVVGNGQNLEITHLSNTFLLSLSMMIKLNIVLVVPCIAKNLLSISQLTQDNELTAEFTA